MKILLSIVSFFSLRVKELGLHKELPSLCHNFDFFASEIDNTSKQGVFYDKKQGFFEKMNKQDVSNTIQNTHTLSRDFMRLIAISFFLLLCSIIFVNIAKGNSPISMNPSITSGTYSEQMTKGVWRLRIFDAAIVRGNTVMLGEIAEPLGDISAQEWQELANKPLWPAPNQVGRPFQINKQRLLGALRQYIGMYADSCILPNSLAIQKGGAVILADDLRRIVIQRLSAQINALGGHSDLTDYRVPPYVFIAHASQSLILEPTEVKAGRVNIRFGIQELDGSIIRRFSGSVFLNLWVDAPALVRPMSKGDAVRPADIMYKSVNLAFENGELWDGRGGPWQLVRSVGASEALAIADLKPLAVVHKGDRVLLLYQKGNIRLSIVAEAMEDGGLGDLILVRNLDSKKQIYGMVKDQNTVISR